MDKRENGYKAVMGDLDCHLQVPAFVPPETVEVEAHQAQLLCYTPITAFIRKTDPARLC
jgi:hypothetical protein